MNTTNILRQLFPGFRVEEETVTVDTARMIWEPSYSDEDPVATIVRDHLEFSIEHTIQLRRMISPDVLKLRGRHKVESFVASSQVKQWFGAMQEGGPDLRVDPSFAWWLFSRTGGRVKDIPSEWIPELGTSVVLVNPYVQGRIGNALFSRQDSQWAQDCYPVGGPLFHWDDYINFRQDCLHAEWLPDDMVLVTPRNNLVLVAKVDNFRWQEITRLKSPDWGRWLLDMDFSWGLGVIDPDVVELVRVNETKETRRGKAAWAWIEKRFEDAMEKAFHGEQ